jgi:hypothetical protein
LVVDDDVVFCEFYLSFSELHCLPDKTVAEGVFVLVEGELVGAGEAQGHLSREVELLGLFHW